MERAVPVAVDPAVERGVLDVFCRPIAGRNIVEATELLHDFRIAVAVHIKEADRHRGKLSTGNGIVGGKDGLTLAVGNAVVAQILHIAAIPGMGGNICKFGICRSGNGIAILLRQQTGEDGGGFTAGHAAAGAEGAVRVADDVNAVALGLLHFGDGQLTVFVGLACGRLTEITLDRNIFALLGSLLVVGDNDRHLMLGVQIRAVRQLHRDIAGLADGHCTAGDGALRVRADDLDGQRPAIAVRILIASSDLAVLVGLTAAGGDGDLTCLVGLAGGVVVILIRDRNAHTGNGTLVLDKLHGHGGLVGVVQQAAVRQADGDAVILVERNCGVCHRIFGVGIRDGHKVAAYNGFTLTVRGGAVVDLLDGLCLQLFATHGTFLVLAALGIGGRLLVNDPVAGFMTGRLGVIGFGGIAAAGAGVGGVTHLGAGGGGHFGLVIMSQRVFQHRAALGTELRLGAGGIIAGNMTCRLITLDAMIAAAGAAVFHDSLTGAGGVGNEGTLIPAMAECVSVVRDEAASAAIAAVDGLAAALTGRGDDMGFVVMGQNGSDVLDMAVAANGALADGVARVGAGGGHGVGLIDMLAPGRGGLLHLAAAGAELQHLAVCLAGGVTDDDALPCVTEGVHIVALFDFAALRAEVAVIAEAGAAGLGAVQQNILVVFTTALVGTAISVAILVLAAAVWISAAAGTGAVILGGFITEPDLCHAILGHFLALVGVGDLIIDHVLTGFCVVGCGGHGAAIRAVAVADRSADTGFGEIADRDGVGLSVHHAVIVCNDRLCRRVVIAGVVAQAAFLHRSEASVCRLGQDFRHHAVALQFGTGRMVRAVAERAVGAALGGNSVIGIIRILVGNGFVQFLRKCGGTVIQPVDIFQIAVLAFAHICVDAAAGLTDGFGVVIPGVGGVLAGNAVHRITLTDTIYHRAVRIFHIAAECRLAIAGIFGNAEHLKRCGFAALTALEGLAGHNTVGVQLIGTAGCLHPVLGGVVVAVLLGGKGGGDHAHAHDQRQKQRQRSAGIMVLFQIHRSSLYFLFFIRVENDVLLTIAPFPGCKAVFADTRSNPCRSAVSPR